MLKQEYRAMLTTKTKQVGSLQMETLENIEELNPVQMEITTEEQPSSITPTYNLEIRGVKIRNESKYEVTEEMLGDTSYYLKKVMLFHTHTCESYTPSEHFFYEHNGNFRTTDLEFTVAKVGDFLEENLRNIGIEVLHDKTYHDYPNYTGSYGRSYNTVQTMLNQNGNTDVIFDVHRDAISDNTYAPKVKIGEEMASQVMFVIGTDGSGLEHPNWIQNLKFAIQFQEKANELYPGLMKPIILRNSRYNQNLGKAATIIEVGATGNTLDECKVSMKYFTKVYEAILSEN